MEIIRYLKLNNKAKVEPGGKMVALNAFIGNRKVWQQRN